MWQLQEPKPVKLIVGILAADKTCLDISRQAVISEFGKSDFLSEVWLFTQTDYYKNELGDEPLRQFISIENLIHPGELAKLKHKTNQLEQSLAEQSGLALSRPVNLDPGIIEPSKLILASTKNFSHRIYIGEKMYAEVTLTFDKGNWNPLQYTFPDYRQGRYFDFFDKVRNRLVEQLKS